MSCLIPARAAVTNATHVVRVEAGASLRQLAEKTLGDGGAAAELMQFNRMKKPVNPEGGAEFVLPGEARTLALAALNRAEQELVEADTAMAGKFAPGTYGAAVRSLEQARSARLEAKYDQAAMIARVAAVQAEEAARQAREKAVVDEPAKVAVISGTGDVELSSDGGVRWRVAKVGDEMRPGMRLRTAADTRAEVRLGDGSSLRVTPGTVMELPENTVDQRDLSRRTTLIKVLLGDILGEIKKRGDAANPTNSTFRIQAGKTAISIRGTTLLVGANEASETRVSMHEGRADVAARRTVKLEKDFGLLVKPNEKMRDPEQLPPPPALVWPKGKDEVTKLQQPVIRWTAPEPNTASVRVQVSRDDRFNDIVHDQVGKVQKEGASAVARVLAAGKYFARVSALTASGLEGAPTAALAFEVRPDLGVRFRPKSSSFVENGVHFAGPGFTLNPEVEPGNRILAKLERKDGAGWKNAEPEGRDGESRTDGHFRATARAVGPDNAPGPEEVLEYVIDGTAPRLSLQSSQPDTGRDITRVAVTATDENGVAKVEYRLNEGDWQPYTDPVHVTHLDNTRFEVRATDRLGNVTAPMTLELPGSRVRR